MSPKTPLVSDSNPDLLDPSRPFLRPPIVESLDLESMGMDQTHRVRLVMTQNASGNETLVPTFVLRSPVPGPTVFVCAAIHGNELNGVPIVTRLMARLTESPRDLHRGTIIAVPVLNIPGYLAFTRYYEDGADLNRIMPGLADGNESQLYAHRIVDRLLAHADVLIDLHTASFGRQNSFYVRADLDNPRVERMARKLDPQIILHSPNADGTLRGTAAARGVDAVTVEVGNPNIIQGRLVKEAEQGIVDVLADLGMMTPTGHDPADDVVVCRSSKWVHTDRGGMLRVLVDLAKPVSAGDVVATLRNAWGDLVREFRAPYAGVVIGRSTNPAARAGSRIVHIGRVNAP